MVEYFELKSFSRFLPSIHSKMNCYFCELRGVRKSRIPVVDKEVILCGEHYRKFGRGIEEMVVVENYGNGPALQDF